jgi:hypothetical protein
MPSMLSPFMARRKQDDSWGHGVPALKSVGVACVNAFCDIISYALSAPARS